MKSIFSKMLTCSALVLATFTANATEDHGVLRDVIAHAGLTIQQNFATYAFVLRASTNVYASIPLDKVALSDEDQADSSDAETMLA